MTISLIALNQPPPSVTEALSHGYDLQVIDPQDPNWTVDGPDSIRGMVNFSDAPLDAALMDRLPALEVISGVGVGYDTVDVDAAVVRNIVVAHTPDVLNEDVANHALMLLLSASRDLILQDHHVRSGNWAEHGQPPLKWTIEGQTIGIVGLGRIGRTLARKLQSAFGVTVLYYGRQRQDVPYEYCPDLADMARRSKALVAVLPGGSGTDGLITREVIRALGPEGCFVNVGRGSTVDEPALIDALRSSALGCAALDVFADEPNVPQALRDLPNVVLTPHIASATAETRAAMFALVVDNIRAFFETGQAKTPVPECKDMG